MSCLGIHIGGDAGMEFAVVVEDTQGVFAHLISGKEFRGGVGEVQTQLQSFAMDLRTEFVVGQQQAALRTRGGTAGIEKPVGDPVESAWSNTKSFFSMCQRSRSVSSVIERVRRCTTLWRKAR